MRYELEILEKILYYDAEGAMDTCPEELFVIVHEDDGKQEGE